MAGKSSAPAPASPVPVVPAMPQVLPVLSVEDIEAGRVFVAQGNNLFVMLPTMETGVFRLRFVSARETT